MQAPATLKAANQLEALKQMSKVVADTGEVDAIRRYKPFDCTTNPSLVYKAMQLPEYEPYLRDAIAAEKESHKGARPYAYIADRLAVNIGAELSKLVPGRVGGGGVCVQGGLVPGSWGSGVSMAGVLAPVAACLQ